MNTRRSRPSSSMPTGDEAPSNPACLTARRKAWIERECGVEGRRTCGPTRTTRPAFAIPPSSCCSATPPLCQTNGAAADTDRSFALASYCERGATVMALLRWRRTPTRAACSHSGVLLGALSDRYGSLTGDADRGDPSHGVAAGTEPVVVRIANGFPFGIAGVERPGTAAGSEWHVRRTATRAEHARDHRHRFPLIMTATSGTLVRCF